MRRNGGVELAGIGVLRWGLRLLLEQRTWVSAVLFFFLLDLGVVFGEVSYEHMFITFVGCDMPRPCKRRSIAGMPGSVVYKPAGIPASALEWLSLGLDEFEAIRLLDYEGLDQEAAAVRMGVSRPTVTRVYASARRKIAEALTEGKAISIEGGPVERMGMGNRGMGRGMGRGCQGRRGWRGGQGE